ncbi:hypothetical protein DUK53_17085 [Listeria sp. SHR_NRA_18]|uniref:hypothetical protein n=1 Tax=Listeria sp. SHR_NRA_18 TaxID=2269046 RepID=UPI000F5FA99C|nr:hypothetical protein [Listeria sp. SHR_NRA_18]RQW65313.1 hypothetical protein DUK53_17085 [Listeria sp. SHR_NRA_18]
MKDNRQDYVILGGKKYYRTVAPILSAKRWAEMEALVRQSIHTDTVLEFVLCIGSYEEIIRGKPFLLNESLQSFLVNHRVVMAKEIVEIRYPTNKDQMQLELEAAAHDFF